ncbi:leucine-rich repeat-containing protein 51-like [Polistes fuscatus]|uniref:leucine-rich repeat-containing protein 51-like n=1 Tax=Polistes fuscatus TaxID=30207 RepID=UPI001CA8F62F|nr:leucine-rich repeat-containing protein 51-like [Polistes fuscatus]
MNSKNANANFTSDYKRNEREEMLIAPPLDFSFKKATNMNELVNQQPQTVRTVKAPIRTSNDRFATSTIWLSNNLLKSMDGLEIFTKTVLEDPTCLSWLDLSFNAINEIGVDIGKFPNLKILYLHGNNISNINDVLKLRKLCNMRALTLHGNPIETLSYYRGYIINVMSQLINLDFSPITMSEKKRAVPAGFFKIIQPAF